MRRLIGQQEGRLFFIELWLPQGRNVPLVAALTPFAPDGASGRGEVRAPVHAGGYRVLRSALAQNHHL
jgi:hypothetical protein